jgi:hypothetical protein
MRSVSKGCGPTMAALFGSLLLAGAAQAVPVYSGVVNLAIPNTTAGLYLNVLNGTSYSGPNTFPALGEPGANYDFNVFGTTTWSFFSPTTSGQSAPTVPTTSRGYVSASTTTGAVSLTLGTLVGGSSIFNTGSPSGAAVSTGAPVLIGFRFRNEGADLTSATDDTVHYGWARLILTPGVPGTLVDYGFESTPLTAIAAGVTGAVPEPGAWAMMVLGLAGLLARQRKTRA